MWFIDNSYIHTYIQKYSFIADNNTTLLFNFVTSRTVDYSNFFDFGVDRGDTQLNRIDDGSSPPFSLPIPIQFFERSQSTIYVSWFCIHSLCRVMFINPALIIAYKHCIYFGGHEILKQ